MPSEDPFSIALQPRDIELLRDLFGSRVMTLAHITALHFSRKAEAAKKRLQKLKAALNLRIGRHGNRINRHVHFASPRVAASIPVATGFGTVAVVLGLSLNTGVEWQR